MCNSHVCLFIFRTYTAYWIGLNDRVNETGYVWSDGSGFEFSKWGPTEPNNYNNEDCTQIIGYPTTSKGNWNDNNCFLSLNYICKINRGIIFTSFYIINPEILLTIRAIVLIKYCLRDPDQMLNFLGQIQIQDDVMVLNLLRHFQLNIEIC